MRGQKFLSILMIMCLALAVFVHPLFVYSHDDGGGTDVTHSDGGHTGGGKGNSGTGNSGKGHNGQGGSHSEVIGTEDEEEGGSDNSEDHKGGISRGGQGKGGSGAKKGNPKKDSAGGTITLVVTVEGLDPVQEVNVILTRDGVDYVKKTVNGVAIFISEASGDCYLKGEDVPCYITPEKAISLIGVSKEVEEKLKYLPGNIPVTGVHLDKHEINLINGYTDQLTAGIEPANANIQDVVWTSSDDEVATVVNGLVTGKGSGVATITVKTVDGGFIASCEVTVVSIQSLENLADIDALKNETVILPKYIDANLDNNTTVTLPVTWEDENGTDVGSTFHVPLENPLDTYTFTGHVIGTNITATLIINVDKSAHPAVPVIGVNLDIDSISLYVEETHQLIAALVPSTATNQALIWTSSNISIATVNDGLVTAKSPGTAIITVETVDGGHKAYCMVSVATAPEISLIYPTLEGGEFAEHFETREEIYINIENLIAVKEITIPTTYYVKVEQKGSSPILGEGDILINPSDTEFNLFEVTEFKLTSNYSNEYFVSMSTSKAYPKNDELTLKTNFKIDTAVPTIPKENVEVSLEIIDGPKEGSPEGIIFLLCRELDEPISDITWDDYLDVENDQQKIHILLNPYNFELSFTDEVKMKGITDANGNVIWEDPRELLKLGGYILLEVTPNGYADNLNEFNPESEDGALLKEVHLTRDGFIIRKVTNIYIGDENNHN